VVGKAERPTNGGLQLKEACLYRQEGGGNEPRA
jgi:hypothetical protein